jgi:hypothetical protein
LERLFRQQVLGHGHVIVYKAKVSGLVESGGGFIDLPMPGRCSAMLMLWETGSSFTRTGVGWDSHQPPGLPDERSRSLAYRSQNLYSRAVHVQRLIWIHSVPRTDDQSPLRTVDWRSNAEQHSAVINF